MSGYVIANIDVKNSEAYKEYIVKETLAVELKVVEESGFSLAHKESYDIEGYSCHVALSKK